MKITSPISRKLARFFVKTGKPLAPVAYDAASTKLTLADGSTVSLKVHVKRAAAYPATFLEACSWLDAIREGREVTPIAPAVVARRRINELCAGFSIDTLTKIVAVAEKLEGGEWTTFMANAETAIAS